MLEESEAWNQSTPLAHSQGLRLLEKLEMKLKSKDRKARAEAFEMARIWASRAAAAGGVGTYMRSFPGGNPIRVDIEVRKGMAFVSG